MMNFGSLFSGIGGFDLGLERAGMKCSWQVEIDKYCLKVLEKHWPEVRRIKDVKECGKHNLEPVELICGGFPCQPHSVAGRRRGAADDRDLWPEMRRVIEELKPCWVFAENVPGIRGTILDQVLSDLEGLDYETGTIVVPACAFNAPHIRSRVFIIAHSNGGRCQRQNLPIRQRGQNKAKAIINGNGKDVANTKKFNRFVEGQETFNLRSSGFDVSNNDGDGLEKSGDKSDDKQLAKNNWWAVEPDVGRVAYGVSRRVDRLRTLGNAVVPQVIEWIGRMIIEIDDEWELKGQRNPLLQSKKKEK